MKLIAEVYSTQQDFSQKLLYAVIYDTETKKLSTSPGDEYVLRPEGELAEGGVMGEDQVRYYPKDGEKFVRAFPANYSGTYVRASLREEK